MSVLTSVGILILAVFACAFLRLAPSVFAIFYHYASAKKSKDKTLDLSSFFVFGAEFMTTTILLLLYFGMVGFLKDNPSFDFGFLRLIAAGICLTLSLFIIFFYYRKGDGTQLFISRKMANSLTYFAKKANKPSDVLALGMVSKIPELIFTLPVYFISIVEIINLPAETFYQPIALIAFIIVSIFPIMIMRGRFYNYGQNLAEIMRSQEQNKNFYRAALAIVYTLLAVVLIVMRFLA